MIKMMGMISKYIAEDGIGTLVLSNGDIKEFSRNDWVDKEYEPSLGQQVLYTCDPDGTKIKTITKEEMEELKNRSVATEDKKPTEEPASNSKFTSVQDAIDYYLQQDYKKTIDKQEGDKRTISMRYYNQGEFAEALISVSGLKIDINETRNGKPVQS